MLCLKYQLAIKEGFVLHHGPFLASCRWSLLLKRDMTCETGRPPRRFFVLPLILLYTPKGLRPLSLYPLSPKYENYFPECHTVLKQNENGFNNCWHGASVQPVCHKSCHFSAIGLLPAGGSEMLMLIKNFNFKSN